MYGSANNWGIGVEAAVAGILWDIFDDVPDDFSTFGNLTRRNYPDGTGDTRSDGITHILPALVDRSPFFTHPLDIVEFWVAWNQSPSFGHIKGLRDVYYEHGDDIFVSCCIGVRGDVNVNGVVDLNDLSSLLSYMTGGGYVLPCPAEANVNGIGIIDLTDVSSLVSYLTGGGYVLPAC